jgi:quercetin dioxygenase-like cupin family protein
VGSDGYEVAHFDEIEGLGTLNGRLNWHPVRREFGIGAFGAGVYTADEGGLLLEDHREKDGHEELYTVLRGRAAFTLGEEQDEQIDATPGTLVFVRPGTRRTAVAREDGTAVLAIGAKRGEVFKPSGWEWGAVAFAQLRAGKEEEGRATLLEGIEANEPHWAGPFNLACYEVLTGRIDEGIEALRRSIELDPENARKFAAEETDFDPIRDDPRVQELMHG